MVRIRKQYIKLKNDLLKQIEMNMKKIKIPIDAGGLKCRFDAKGLVEILDEHVGVSFVICT